jgi:hypothetical protein
MCLVQLKSMHFHTKSSPRRSATDFASGQFSTLTAQLEIDCRRFRMALSPSLRARKSVQSSIDLAAQMWKHLIVPRGYEEEHIEYCDERKVASSPSQRSGPSKGNSRNSEWTSDTRRLAACHIHRHPYPRQFCDPIEIADLLLPPKYPTLLA